MSKKIVFVILVCFAIIVAGCSKGEKESAAAEKDTAEKEKSKQVEASIANASYIKLDNDEGTSDGDTGLLAIELKIKNRTDSGLNISPTQNFKLYDGDEELDANSDATYSLDTQSGKIGSKKAKTIKVVFTVEKDKKYELAVRTMSDKGEEDEAKLKLDTSKYNDSLEALDDPAKALTAYIETIYFDKDNADYEKLVSADKADLQDEAKKAFKEHINRIYYDGVPEKYIDKFYNNFRSTLAEKGELHTETILNDGSGKGAVSLEYTGLPLNDMQQLVSDYRHEYNTKKGYNQKKANEYTLSKYDTMLNKLEPKAGKEIKVKMVQKDGKWTIDASDYGAEDLPRIFAEGKVY